MADHILEMREHHQDFPWGEGTPRRQSDRRARRGARDLRRERRRQVDPDEGAVRASTRTARYEGEIVFEGSRCPFSGIRDSEKSGIVIIHQELALSPFLSIAENIFLGNEQQRGGRIDWNATNMKAAELLRRVGLSENPITKIIDIGVGKQQLVEIAKALSKDVKLLILDEPTAALNDEDSAHLLGLIRGLRDHGITSIIISHKLNEIKAIADRVTIIRDGQTIETLDFACRRGLRGADHPRHGRPGPGEPLSRSARRASARRCCGSRTGRSTTRSSTAGWWSTAPTSTSGPARWSASPG